MTLATTRDLRRAGAVMLAALSKPTRMGRDAFGAQLTRMLSRREIVVLDDRAVGRLGQVDCVLISGEVLLTGERMPERVVAADGVDAHDVHARIRRLFDPEHPRRRRTAGGWAIGPLAGLDYDRNRAAETLVDELDAAEPLGLVHEGQLLAVFETADMLAPGAHQLAEACHRVGALMALGSMTHEIAQRLHADQLLDSTLVDAVHGLQRDGHVVALVAAADHTALRVADVGIGVTRQPPVPWGADLLCRELAQVRFVVEATGVSHEVARQGNAIALSGSSVASMMALTARRAVAGPRALTTVNSAAIAAMGNGMRAAYALGRRPNFDDHLVPRWHELGRSDVFELLGSRADGLTGEEARERLEVPRSAQVRPVALARAVMEELANPLTPVLAGGALLSATFGSMVDAGIVLSVMAFNGVVSGTQRFLAEEAVRSLVAAGTIHAHVHRGPELLHVDGSELVPGDVVELVPGDTVPADCRIVNSSSLEVDEATLTGESDPVVKSPRATYAALITERGCMLYEGSTVVAGSATAMVVATGDDTEAAARAHLAQAPSTGGVEARLRELSTISLPVAGASGVVIAASQLLRGQPLSRALASGVSVTVAAVPEGLPMLATVGQLAAARRLSRHEVLVRNARGIEALGRIEVLCVDKTGTLTHGHVELRFVSDGIMEQPVDQLDGTGCSVLCAALRATPTDDGERALPHFTDRTILDAARRTGLQRDDDARGAGWTTSAELAFGPERPFHAIWGRSDGPAVVSVKGAPEFVLPRCRVWRRGGREHPLPDLDEAQVRMGGTRDAEAVALIVHIDAMAKRGLRILAVAERTYRDDEPPELPTDDDVQGLTLVGFVALADPVRDTAAEAVQALQHAGVKVVMVTGDHPTTAESIAAELGILNGARVLTGRELERLSEAELDVVLDEVSVFARVTPAHKTRIVAAYQRAGTPVGMTGDGANDANAIRAADAGIALGRHGVAAARTAADVIITDDRIETIVEAVIEGRALWAAVRDALAILLGGNLGEIVFMLSAGGVSGRPALSTRQVLLVNLLTDVAPSLALVARPPAVRSPEQLAAEGPNRSLGHSLNVAIVQRAAATSLAALGGWGVARLTGTQRRAGTVGLVSLVGAQLGQTLMMGHRDPVVIAAGARLDSSHGGHRADPRAQPVLRVHTPGSGRLVHRHLCVGRGNGGRRRPARARRAGLLGASRTPARRAKPRRN